MSKGMIVMLLDDPICVIMMESDKTNKDEILSLMKNVKPVILYRYSDDAAECFHRRETERRNGNRRINVGTLISEIRSIGRIVLCDRRQK